MEIIVIGAGIVGVSAGLSLAEHGAAVTVLERGEIASEASGLNAGVISGGGWGDRPSIDVALKMGSLERYVDLVEQRGHDIGLDRTGTLTLLRTEEEWRWAASTVEADRRAGRQTELVSSSELIDLEPAADPLLLGAILDPLGARAEPVAATTAFAREAVVAGASILTNQSVEDIRPTANGGWEVSVSAKGSGRVTVLGADAVIIAAGPWCQTIGAMVGLEIPITAVRGQMWASAPQPPLLRHAIAAAESALAWSNESPDGELPPSLTHRDKRRLTRHLYGRQRPGGEIIFGGDRVLTWDRAVDRDGITVNHGHVAELLPAVRQLPPVRTWAGLMPFSIDGRPLIGPIPDHDGLYLAGGLASSGFGRGPMTGQLIADMVLGRDPGHDTTSVAPGRRIG